MLSVTLSFFSPCLAVLKMQLSERGSSKIFMSQKNFFLFKSNSLGSACCSAKAGHQGGMCERGGKGRIGWQLFQQQQREKNIYLDFR